MRRNAGLSADEIRIRSERINMALAEVGFPDFLDRWGRLLRDDVPPPIVYRACRLALREVADTYEQWLIDCTNTSFTASRWLRLHNAHPSEMATTP